jgi:phosphate transport system protein
MADHTSKEFDAAIARARDLAELLAARVERQLDDALEALRSGSTILVDQILRHETEVNGLERAIDQLAGQVIALRHPAARDLRLLVALLGATTDLERVGDEAKKIALSARSILPAGRAVLVRVTELRSIAVAARGMLGEACAALTSLDPRAAGGLVRRDLLVNESFRAVLARLAGIMVEDPRTISVCLDILFIAKSLERIGDHAKNLAEHVVYAVVGVDVRHASADRIEELVGSITT